MMRLIAVDEETGRQFEIPTKDETGNWIREQRGKRGLSLQDISAKLGVSRQAVFKWESGLNTPSTDHMVQLVELFGVDKKAQKMEETLSEVEKLLLPHAKAVRV